MTRFDLLARDVLAEVEVKCSQTLDYTEHTDACLDDIGPLDCACPVRVDDLLDDLAEAVRHLVWLAQLEEARVPSC